MRESRKTSEETKRKISEALKGRKMSDAEKKKRSIGMLKYWASVPAEEIEK